MPKISIKRTVVLAVGMLAISELAQARHRGDGYTEEFHQTYTLSDDGRVGLENINGDVRISTWNRGEVKVDAVKRADTEDRLRDIEINVDYRPDAIHTKTRYPEHMFHNNTGGVDYTLTVPRHARLDQV